MITRKSLGGLAGITLVLFTVAVIMGDNGNGARLIVGRIFWWSFVACALFLVVASVTTIARRGKQRVRS
jgi:cytochrome c oxidase assembly factor CtaG